MVQTLCLKFEHTSAETHCSWQKRGKKGSRRSDEIKEELEELTGRKHYSSSDIWKKLHKNGYSLQFAIEEASSHDKELGQDYQAALVSICVFF